MKHTRAQVIALHAQGWKDEAIAAEIGVTRSSVTYHRRVLGLPSWCRRLAAERAAQVAALSAQGMSDRAIARVVGFDRATAHYHRTAAGMPANYRYRACIFRPEAQAMGATA